MPFYLFFGGGFPSRLQKKVGALILTSPLEDPVQAVKAWNASSMLLPFAEGSETPLGREIESLEMLVPDARVANLVAGSTSHCLAQ